MPPAMSRTSAEPTLYEILSLTPKRLEGQASAAQQKVIKQAYHKALLKYHPDKNPKDSPNPSSTSSPSPSPSSPKPQHTKPPSSSGKSTTTPNSSGSKSKTQLTFTVDQIQHAYSVLSDARQRREYDRQLLLTSSTATEQRHSVSTRFHTGVETVDLDDLGFDERTGFYFGSCRCGNARGFQFTDAQLEEYEDDLVLMVQCLDCSLWMRVLFDAAEESDADNDARQSSSSPISTSTSNSYSHSHSTPPAATTNYGHNVAAQTNSHPVVVPTTTNQSQGTAMTGERRGSRSISRSGKGWTFNFSFDWGISLSGSGSATANASASPQGRA